MCLQPVRHFGYFYTEEEASSITEIRKMENSERRDFRIKYFEIETGKEFPKSGLINIF